MSSGSPGTTVTPRGPVQGIILIDPTTGYPIITEDGAINVNATVTATIGDIVISADTSSITIRDSGDGTPLLIESDGSINVNTKIQASQDDSVLIFGTQDGTPGGTQQVAKIDANANLNVINMGALIPKVFDSINITNSTISGQTVPTEIEYYTGGLIGTLVATLTLVYDGSANLLTVVRT
jgi:hypothetical protein